MNWQEQREIFEKYGIALPEKEIYGADLSGADLCGANLSGADLSGANLCGADLYGAKNIPDYVLCSTRILPDEGDVVVFKKCREGIAKLCFPDGARRSNATGRKCRAEYADVLALYNRDGTVAAGPFHSLRDHDFSYTIGTRVYCDRWDENRWEECGGGIHAFITRAEAEAFEL